MIVVKSRITTVVDIELTEDEALALQYIASYNHDDFLDCFAEKLGPGIKAHRPGMESLFKNVRNYLARPLERVRDARKLVDDVRVPTGTEGEKK